MEFATVNHWSQMSHLSTEHKIGADLCTKYISNFHNNILETVWAHFCLFYRHQNQDQGIRLKQILSDIKGKNLWSNSGQQICKCNAINRIVSSYKLEIKFNSSVAPKFQMPYTSYHFIHEHFMGSYSNFKRKGPNPSNLQKTYGARAPELWCPCPVTWHQSKNSGAPT